MADTHATDTLDTIVGSLRPGSEILEQLHQLRATRRQLLEENAELRALLVQQNDVIERYASMLHNR